MTELALSLPLFFLMIPAITSFMMAFDHGQGYVSAAMLTAKEISDASLLDSEIPCRNLEILAESEAFIQLYQTNIESAVTFRAEIFSSPHEFTLPQLPGVTINSPEIARIESFYLRVRFIGDEDNSLFGLWNVINNLQNREMNVVFPLAGGCSFA